MNRFVFGKWTFENGMLVIHPQNYEEDPKPFEFGVGDDLQNYFAGPGTDLLCSDRSGHIQGKAGRGVGTCENAPGILTWPDDNPPELHSGETGAVTSGTVYTSEIYDPSKPNAKSFMEKLEAQRFSQDTYQPTLASIHTGLMQLAVQAWMARGIDPETRTPFANYAIDRAGLIRDSENRFWWIETGAAGCFAARMKNSKRTEYIRLNLGSASGDANRKHLALLLADLEPDREPFMHGGQEVEYLELLSAADLNSVYGGRFPLAYGFHYRDRSPWQASVVTHRIGINATLPDWYEEFTLASVDLSFAFDAEAGFEIPSASLNIEEQDKETVFVNGFDLVYPAGTQYCTLLVPPNSTRRDPALLDKNVPFYVFYWPDGTREVLRYTNDYFLETKAECSGDPTPNYQDCVGELACEDFSPSSYANPWSWDYRYPCGAFSYQKQRLGGFSLTGFEYDNEEAQIGGCRYIFDAVVFNHSTQRLTIAGGGLPQGYGGPNANYTDNGKDDGMDVFEYQAQLAASTCGHGPPLASWLVDEVDRSTGQRRSDYEWHSRVLEQILQTVIIPRGSANAVIVARKQITTSEVVDYGYRVQDYAMTAEKIVHARYSCYPPGPGGYHYVDDGPELFTEWTPYEATFSISCKDPWAAVDVIDSDEWSETDVQEEDFFIKVIGAENIQLSQDPLDWPGLWTLMTYVKPCEAFGVYLSEEFADTGAICTTKEGIVENTQGFPVMAVNPAALRWAGDGGDG